MTTPHPYAKEMHAYADTSIPPQWKAYSALGYQTRPWRDWNATNSPPLFCSSVLWRTKPPEPVVLRYRVALMRAVCGPYLGFADNAAAESYVSHHRYFIKWLTDGQEVEIPA